MTDDDDKFKKLDPRRAELAGKKSKISDILIIQHKKKTYHMPILE